MRLRPALVLLGLLACGRGGDLIVDPPGPDYRIVFDPPFHNEIHGVIGFSGQLSVKVLDARGRNVVPDVGPTFQSTNPAAVSVDATGRFTVLAQRGAVILAEAWVRGVRVTGGVAVSVVCTLELRMEMSPVSMSIAIGERFTPSMTVSTCGGHVPVSGTITWSASDTLVLSVHPTTGETVALNTGNAYLLGRISPPGATGVIPVTVR